jgi:DNA repair exonuclease SbcCD ATPase subunit
LSYSEKKSDAYAIIKEAKKEKQKILDKGNTCPTCNREYCEDDLEHIKTEIKKLDDVINKYQPIYDENNKLSEEKSKFGQKITSSIEVSRSENDDYKEEISTSSLHQQKINTLLEKIKEYEENIEEIEQETFKDDFKIENSEKSLEKITKDLETLQERFLSMIHPSLLCLKKVLRLL